MPIALYAHPTIAAVRPSSTAGRWYLVDAEGNTAGVVTEAEALAFLVADDLALAEADA